MVDSLHAWIALAFGTCVLWLLRDGRWCLRGTTMRAPWAWAVLAAVAVTAIEVVAGLNSSDVAERVELARFAAASLTFCPSVAILGAKRPQDRAWQLIVLALWVVLVLPAIEAWLRATVIEVHVVRASFLAILILVGMLNHLPTRFAAAAAAYAAAQTALLWPHLPLLPELDWEWSGLAGLGLLCLSVILLRVRAGTTAAVDEQDTPLGDLAHVWCEFRNWFGAVWSLRVMDRMNASSEMYRWPAELAWDGFAGRQLEKSQTAQHELSVAEREPIEQALRMLLRRFVSAEWIETRLSAARSVGNSAAKQQASSA